MRHLTLRGQAQVTAAEIAFARSVTERVMFANPRMAAVGPIHSGPHRFCAFLVRGLLVELDQHLGKPVYIVIAAPEEIDVVEGDGATEINIEVECRIGLFRERMGNGRW